ncbi:hypothetical protein CEXT_701751 [Caerostris extrusa]|uniref:Uncharacterized protein n=1 Tax=Caerostris extrusa TaxID=172846 RepID=A0AAV4XZU8_CAEEX|nr:hypothetical protein CEXT_701751 [Caerostris extrusa]
MSTLILMKKRVFRSEIIIIPQKCVLVGRVEEKLIPLGNGSQFKTLVTQTPQNSLLIKADTVMLGNRMYLRVTKLCLKTDIFPISKCK